MFFALVHLHVLCFIVTTHPTCVSPLLANDMHIISPTLDVLPIFLQLHEEFGALGFSMQLMKCVAWFP